MKISILIPVYNEQKTLLKLLKKVDSVKLPKGIKKELIIVDDGSSDNSLQILKNYAKKRRNVKYYCHKINKGKGAALRTAMSNSSGDIVFIQDADLEYDPNDIPRLIKPIVDGKYKVVYGSRLKHFPLRFFGKRKTPLLTHYLGNKLLTLATNILYSVNLSDMETCYKVFDSRIFDDLKIESDKFNFEPEITAKILKNNIKIHEISIKVKPRGYEEGKKISWKDGFSALWTLLKYRFF